MYSSQNLNPRKLNAQTGEVFFYIDDVPPLKDSLKFS